MQKDCKYLSVKNVSSIYCNPRDLAGVCGGGLQGRTVDFEKGVPGQQLRATARAVIPLEAFAFKGQ